MKSLNREEEKESSLEGDLLILMEEEPGHFTRVDFRLEELTGADAAIWEQVKQENLNKEELREYTAEVHESGSLTREAFLGIVNNKAMGIWIQREIDARRKNKAAR